MFRRHDVTLMSNPVCRNAAPAVTVEDFQYYDKDGFELNKAEQKFYARMNFPIHYPILNHTCWQEPWFELEREDQGLILDHSMFLCRCSYAGAARSQLESLVKTAPKASLLLNTKIKWGFDFALDAHRDGEIFEVLHIEYDHISYEHFSQKMMVFDYTVRHTDWYDAADRVWANRDQWQHLQGFDQNNWKAQYLLNWDRAEYVVKSI